MPRLIMDLDKIEHNTRLVSGMLAPHGVRLTGVTKACPGEPRVAAAMLSGGAAALADSRVASISRLRQHLPGAELHLLRSQPGDEIPAGHADLFFVSSASQAGELLMVASDRPLRLCLTIETGDGREGVPPEAAAREASRLAALPGVELAGVATNVACAANGTRLDGSLDILIEVAEDVAAGAGEATMIGASGTRNGGMMMVSAGGSGLLRLLVEGSVEGSGRERFQAAFSRLTDMRCGEALLLGRIPSGGGGGIGLPGAHGDAFVLDAPVLEVRHKGGRLQVLAGLGIQDTGAGALFPLQPYLSVTQVTSDYLALAVHEEDAPPGAIPAIGSRLAFIPSYYALLAAMTSPHVRKDPVRVSIGGNPA